jgi:acetolactate synthase-1/2/3 large subunit
MAFESFAQHFSHLGGRRVFGVPGGGPSLELITRIEENGGRFTATGHESVAALMAGAYARQTQAPGLCVTIKGPGFINLAPGLLCNSHEGYPCLSVSESYPTPEPTGRRHKWLDHVSVASGFLRGSASLDGDPGNLDAAWSLANSEFPGPVHLNLGAGTPPDLGGNEAPPDPAPPSWLATVEGAQRPALLLGSWACRASWGDRLRSLRVPTFTTAAAKGVIPENSAHAAGIATGDGAPGTPEKTLLPKADLLICLGVRSGEMLSPNPPHDACLWLEDATLTATRLFPDNPLGENALRTTNEDIGSLLDILSTQSWGTDEVAASIATLHSNVESWDDSPKAAFELASTRIPGAAHTVDTGNFTVWAEHFLRVDSHLDLTGTPNGRYLGTGIGYALGTAMARAPRPSILWIGDGGIRAHLGELAIAVAEKLPLLVVVMTDGFLGSIRGRARKLGWSQAPLTLGDHKLRKVADAMGLATWAAGDAGSLDQALGEWTRDGHPPALIEYALAPETYVDMTERLR